MKPCTIYLAGPMRGYPLFNFPAFEVAENALVALGFKVISPARHDLDAGFDPKLTLEENERLHAFDLKAHMAWDLRVILSEECQGVILMPGWRNSTGCRNEVLVAQTAGRPVFELTEEGLRPMNEPVRALLQ